MPSAKIAKILYEVGHPFANWQRFGGKMFPQRPVPKRERKLPMPRQEPAPERARKLPRPRQRGHEARQVRTYTLPGATCALRSLAPETQRQGALLPRHSQRRGALLPQHPQRQGVRPPTPTASAFPAGPRLRRALPLRDLPRQGFRAPAPTASVSPLEQAERFRRSITGG